MSPPQLLPSPVEKCKGNHDPQTREISHVPVSYTHLDVYKRQTLDTSEVKSMVNGEHQTLHQVQYSTKLLFNITPLLGLCSLPTVEREHVHLSNFRPQAVLLPFALNGHS